MNLVSLINKRRAYRSLLPVTITDEIIQDLAKNASLSPSCFNNQPWRYVFVYEKKKLGQTFAALSKGNQWAEKASLIIAVFSKKDYDCLIKGREYYLFDTGMASAFLILRATDLGLVAHPIAGFNESMVKDILDIPEEMTVITLIIVGKHSKKIGEILSEKQVEWEKVRPERMSIEKFIFLNKYSKEDDH